MTRLNLIAIIISIVFVTCSKEALQEQVVPEADFKKVELLQAKTPIPFCNKYGPLVYFPFNGGDGDECYFIYVFRNNGGQTYTGTWVKKVGSFSATVGYQNAVWDCGFSTVKGCSILQEDASYKYWISLNFYANPSASMFSTSPSFFVTEDCTCGGSST